jgi:HAD superfamily hydrolase (TIGR01450 family)
VTTADHDAVLLDLDGVVYAGERAVPGAPEALARMREEGTPLRFVTNNASRTPEQVAEKLVSVGVRAVADEVLGSARAAAELLVDRVGLAPGSQVAVVGGVGLLRAVEEAGLRPVPVLDVADRPDAIVQGFSPDLGWAHLAEGTFWVRHGVTWVASNLDLTIPTAKGLAPGNGLLVHVVAEASGRRPDFVAGKPEPFLFLSAARSAGSTAPLVVGDRLDTDIAGGRAAGFPTALVLTGVHGLDDALAAGPAARPDRVLLSLADLWDSGTRAEADQATARLHEAWAVLDDQAPAGTDGAAQTQRAALLREWSQRLSPAAR